MKIILHYSGLNEKIVYQQRLAYVHIDWVFVLPVRFYFLSKASHVTDGKCQHVADRRTGTGSKQTEEAEPICRLGQKEQ